MFTTGGTGGGAGSPAYNLSLAQFQQRVADAQIDCVKCKKGKLGKAGAQKACKAFVRCRYCTPQLDLPGGVKRNCCDLEVSAVSSQSSCSRDCPCGEESISSSVSTVAAAKSLRRSRRASRKAGKEEKVVEPKA